MKRLKTFSVGTKTEFATYEFLTKGRDGKDALKNLINNSKDFRYLLTKKESYNMSILVKYLKSKKG